MQDNSKDTALISLSDNTPIPQTDPIHEVKTDGADKSRGKKNSGLSIFLRVLAIIASVLLAIILLLGLTLGVLLGTLSAQLSPEAVDNAVYSTDFNAILSAMGVDDEMANLYNGAVGLISSESTDYYETLEEFLASRKFKDFVCATVGRLIGAFSEDGFSVYLRSGDVMMLAGFLTGPVEQYLGFTLTDDHMDIMESVLDILGVGGKLLTVPLGEFVGIIYMVRLLLTDSLRYVVFFACAVAAALILLLNKKHLLTGALMCAVPLVLTCIASASFSFTVTLVLAFLREKIYLLINPILIYTSPARDYMANMSLFLFVFAIIIMLIPRCVRSWGLLHTNKK